MSALKKFIFIFLITISALRPYKIELVSARTPFTGTEDCTLGVFWLAMMLQPGAQGDEAQRKIEGVRDRYAGPSGDRVITDMVGEELGLNVFAVGFTSKLPQPFSLNVSPVDPRITHEFLRKNANGRISDFLDSEEESLNLLCSIFYPVQHMFLINISKEYSSIRVYFDEIATKERLEPFIQWLTRFFPCESILDVRLGSTRALPPQGPLLRLEAIEKQDEMLLSGDTALAGHLRE